MDSFLLAMGFPNLHASPQDNRKYKAHSAFWNGFTVPSKRWLKKLEAEGSSNGRVVTLYRTAKKMLLEMIHAEFIEIRWPVCAGKNEQVECANAEAVGGIDSIGGDSGGF
jgi:hypothetical protein